MDCYNVDCPCKATQCVNCGKPIDAGDIICSDLCNGEMDCAYSLDLYLAILYPHG